MKKYFITGLVILLPLALTVAIVSFIFNLLTDPFVGLVKAIFDYNGWFTTGFLFLTTSQTQQLFSQLIIIILLFFVTAGLGFIARLFFFNYILGFWELDLKKIPFIISIYTTCQDVIQTIFTTDSNAFKQVVLVPFPSMNAQAIGLVTSDNLPKLGSYNEPFVAVFIPTTPNPTSGFLVMFKKTDVVYLDMKVEDAFKYVISCGMIPTSFNPTQRDNP